MRGLPSRSATSKKLYSPPSAALTIGSAVDRSVTADLRRKMETGILLPDAEIKDIARDELVARAGRKLWSPKRTQHEALATSSGTTPSTRPSGQASLHHSHPQDGAGN